MQKLLILMILLLVVTMSMERSEIKADHGSDNPRVLSVDPSWAEWEYMVYQYPNVFQVYVVFKDARKSLLQGKSLSGNGGKPMEGKTLNSIKTGWKPKLAPCRGGI